MGCLLCACGLLVFVGLATKLRWIFGIWWLLSVFFVVLHVLGDSSFGLLVLWFFGVCLLRCFVVVLGKCNFMYEGLWCDVCRVCVDLFDWLVARFCVECAMWV